MNNVTSVEVLLAGVRVGELVSVPRRGTFFAYDEQWLASGFNLSPLNMEFKSAPQAAPDSHLFGGLMGVFADSLPDGWGMLLMDRFFLRERGIDRRAITALDRLAYMGNRAMGLWSICLYWRRRRRTQGLILSVCTGLHLRSTKAIPKQRWMPCAWRVARLRGGTQGGRGAVAGQAALCLVI